MKTYKTICPELKLKAPLNGVLKACIKSSKDSSEYFRQVFDSSTIDVREEFLVIYLNRANNTVGWFRVGVGGLASVVVDIRIVFKMAFECNATCMIVAHNHPSGNLKPSQHDINITKKLSEAGKLLEITVVDHLILTSDNYYSFADEGLI